MSQQVFCMMKQEAELKAEIESLQQQKKPIDDQISELCKMLHEIKEDRHEIERQEAKVTNVNARQRQPTNKPKDKDDKIYSQFLRQFKNLQSEQQDELLRKLEESE